MSINFKLSPTISDQELKSIAQYANEAIKGCEEQLTELQRKAESINQAINDANVTLFECAIRASERDIELN